LHEFSTIPGVKEDVTDIVLNIKNLRFKLHTDRPKTVRLRKKGPGEARANIHAGGVAQPSKLDDRDLEICEAIGPALQERGLVFVGIDVIGGYLTEINVTSPTGIQEIDRFDNASLESKVWDAIETRFASRHPRRKRP